MFPPQEGSLCGELIKMLEDLALVRVFTRTPMEEGLSFEMLNKLPTVDGVKKAFQATQCSEKCIHLRTKTK